MSILKVSTIVKNVLIESKESRDNDNLLILKVWAIQNPELRNDRSLTYYSFAKLFLNGSLSSAESITRARRKIQEEIETLRGYNYKSRQTHQEKVKEELKDLSLIKGGTP